MNVPTAALIAFEVARENITKCVRTPSDALYWAHQATIHVGDAYRIIAREQARANRPSKTRRGRP